MKSTHSFSKAIIFIVVLFFSTVLEAAKIVTTVYPADDIVVVDFDVTDFGVDLTGVEDATSIIQAAIDSCYNSGGGTVWMPVGNYKVTSTIYVRSFVTLRGDWRDPDVPGSDYGTLIIADVTPGDTGDVLFQTGGSAGVMGVTVFYPDQNAINPVHYNYTFNFGRWAGQPGTYMANNLINCTLLNSYKGIGKGAIDNSQVNECATVRNIKGTVLYCGIAAFNTADVDNWCHINFYNRYWADAGAAYNAPALSALNAWTRVHGIAFKFGDLEWAFINDINCSDYLIGLNIVQGARASFCGQLFYSSIIHTTVAIQIDNLDNRWGVALLRCTLDGSVNSVRNNCSGYVKMTDCLISGPTLGNVQFFSPGTSPVSYDESTASEKVSSNGLYDVTKPPYNAPFKRPQTGLPDFDATNAIQAALDDAGNHGGGVVYLPAGWYKINRHLIVPSNVELRGCSSVPQLDHVDLSLGTTIMGFEGVDSQTHLLDTALITLAGNSSGVRGIKFFYPVNNPGVAIKPYPYTIRGLGSHQYIVNIAMTGVYNAIDFEQRRCDNHLIRSVMGTVYNRGIVVGNGSNGWIESCQTNPGKVLRCNYKVPGWTSNHAFSRVLDSVTKICNMHIVVNGAENEQILNCFSYGANTGLWVQSGTARCFNFGVDNVALYAVRADCGSEGVSVMNLMRYNGTTSSGEVYVYNEMHLSEDLNPLLVSPVITSIPNDTGAAGVPYKYVIHTTGFPPPAVSVTGNPSWLTLNDSVLSGIPQDAQVYGPVTVIASNSAPCPYATQTFNIDCRGVHQGINDFEKSVKVYPNPATNMIFIEAMSPYSSTCTISLSSITGQSLFTKQSDLQEEYYIDASLYREGMYFLKLQDKEDYFVTKIEIKK